MQQEIRSPGTTTIAPEVLLSIAKLTTESVRGVYKMAEVPVGMNWIFGKVHQADGVQVSIEDNKTVNINLFVILDEDEKIREIGRQIQQKVSRAMEEMVGMKSGTINVNIEDIYFKSSLEGPAE